MLTAEGREIKGDNANVGKCTKSHATYKSGLVRKGFASSRNI